MTFKDQQINSMTFQDYKKKFLNFMTLQVFYDPYKHLLNNDSKVKFTTFWGNNSIAVPIFSWP